MPLVSFSQLRKQIADNTLAPVYVVAGEDETGKAEIVDLLIESVDEGLRAFNFDRLDASSATNADARDALTAQLLGLAHTYPMMAPHRLVVLQRADVLLFPKSKREEDGGESEPAQSKPGKRPPPADDPIEAYLDAPERGTTMVFVVKGLPQNRRIGKRLQAEAAVVACGVDIEESEALPWVASRAKAAGVAMDAGAVSALVARTGTSKVRLRAGFERVVLYTLGQASITKDDVTAAVPPAPDALANFGIANAIRDGDAPRSLSQLATALEDGAAPYFLLGQLRTAAEGVRGPKVRDAIDAVFRTDLALKSSAGDPRVLLERLVVELCEFGRGRWGGRF